MKLRFPPCQRSGSAIVITLLFVSLLTVLVVGFMETTRFDRSVSDTHLERTRATSLARMGIDNSVAILARETRDPARNWVTQPGLLIVGAESDTSGTAEDERKVLTSEVLLSTGAPSNLSGSPQTVSYPPNLNIQSLTDQNPPTYLIDDRPDQTGKAPELRVRWLYVRADGTYELPRKDLPIGASFDDGSGTIEKNLPIENPPLDKANPIVGRFAYWVDDESTKVNLNLAWKRSPKPGLPLSPTVNAAAPAHASQVSLLALQTAEGGPYLTESLADLLQGARPKFDADGNILSGRYFNSFADARQVDAQLAKALNHNKFQVTHYNHDPDTTFFGEDRILLTTNRNLVPHIKDPATGRIIYLRKFLDILRDDLPDNAKTFDPTFGPELDPGNKFHIAARQDDFSLASATDPASRDQQLVPDILGAPETAGGAAVNKFDRTVKMLVNYLKRKDWPIAPGKSFANKFYYNPDKPNDVPSDTRLAQLAINIISYVCARESPEQFSSTLRFGLNGYLNEFTLHNDFTAGHANSFQAVARTPMVTEFAAVMEKTPVTFPPTVTGHATDQYYFRQTLRWELYLPESYGPTGLNLVPDTSANPGPGSLPGCWISMTGMRGGIINTAGGTYPNSWYIFPDGYAGKLTQFRNWADVPPYEKGPMVPPWNNVESYKGRLPNVSTASLRIFQRDIVSGGTDSQGNPSSTGTWLWPGRYLVVEKVIYQAVSKGNPVKPPVVPNTAYDVRVSFSASARSDDRGHIEPTYSGGPPKVWDADNRHSLYGTIAPQSTAKRYVVAKQDTIDWAAVPSLEVDDPRAALSPVDWRLNKNGGNTLGSKNSWSSLGQTPSGLAAGTPQQDTDIGGTISDASFILPPPAGTKVTLKDGRVIDNTLGRVTSVGELGYVHTGNESDPSVVAGSVPWRTFRLQPNQYKTSDTAKIRERDIPDWVLMDLFDVPRVNSNKRVPNTAVPLVENNVDDPSMVLHTPHGTSVGGRVNVNSKSTPFELERKTGLFAVFKDAPHLRSGQDAETLSANIYERNLAAATGDGSQGKIYGYPGPDSSQPNTYDTPGEICEIAGIADGGEASEDLVRDVIGLTTARGGVFGIYTVGQSLKQSPTGQLVVTGEQRQHAIVERYVDNRGTPAAPEDDAVNFRTVYFRTLTP